VRRAAFFVDAGLGGVWIALDQRDGLTATASSKRRAVSPLRRSAARVVLNFWYYVPLGIIGIELGWPSRTVLVAAIRLRWT
jgi:hypothetical protein